MPTCLPQEVSTGRHIDEGSSFSHVITIQVVFTTIGFHLVSRFHGQEVPHIRFLLLWLTSTVYNPPTQSVVDAMYLTCRVLIGLWKTQLYS